MKIKESEKIDKYLDLAWEQKKKKKQWDIKVSVMPIVVGSSGIIPEGLKKKMGKTIDLGEESKSTRLQEGKN